MHRPQFEVARIVNRFGQQFVEQYRPNSFIVRTLDVLQKCRTAALGGHIDYCDYCGEQRISYNSCGNRHCPKCQGAKQALWVEDRMNDAWGKNWNVHCEPPFGNAQQIVKYLGQYSHRVAISNHRIKNISDSGVTFFYKDYKDNSKVKPATLSGVEFLRRFCMHILPKRFVKIRYYGILSSKQKDRVKSLLVKKPEIKVKETRQERIVRLTGFDSRLCPVCKTGFMHTIELLPKIRAPTNVLYPTKILSC